ncbi:MAG: ATP-binding protein [bacterium]|nr:MAG: ATP-binding protein [bacterium]
MRIAVASGKGGTGKTTVAVHAAVTAASSGINSVYYVDCDVEEPNGHIFLKPDIIERETVTVPVPVIDESACTHCGDCGQICQFNAIAVILDKVITFNELCHGCGGCTRVCPAGAITESTRRIGSVERGVARIREHETGSKGSALHFVHGRLDVGEPLAPPVVRRVKERIPDVPLVIIDAPPGASCPVVESVRDSDYVLLVTEPTPFGLNDLEIAVETMRELHLPIGVVINRAGTGDDGVKKFCNREGLEILDEIPDDRRIAELYSRGELVTDGVAEFEDRMKRILEKITGMEVAE